MMRRRTVAWIAALLAAVSLGTAAAQPGAAHTEQNAADRVEAALVVSHRQIATFRSPLLGMSPTVRVQHARTRVADLLAVPGDLNVDALAVPQGRAVQVGGALAFVLTPEDPDRLAGESLDDATRRAVDALRLVVRESRESRDMRALSVAAGRAGLATLVALALIVAASRTRRRIDAWVCAGAQRRTERLHFEGAQLLSRERVLAFVERALRVAFAGLVALVAYVWLGFALAQFPFTRAFGERLNDYAMTALAGIVDATLAALPDLFVAVLIFVVARVIVRAVRAFFDRVASGDVRLQRLDPDLAATTRRVVTVLIWLFALAMAYPYVPGSDSEAFKGLSVVVGLMVSLGAAGQVGQALSGLVLAYTRVFRRGEYVRIGDHEGTVTELGVFATRIRTGMGDELAVPNSLVLASVTRNYSRTSDGAYIVDAKVTIGYDTPWRQVHAMLLEAAARTRGVAREPAPRVYQVALGDFYPEYRLVCRAVPGEAVARADVVDALHAAIQDVFNEYGVQIMSPHYVLDPRQPKIVRRDAWHKPPAAAEAADVPHERVPA